MSHWQGNLSGVITIVLMAVFVAIWVWAWRPRHRPTFEDLSKLPLEDLDGREGPPSAGRSAGARRDRNATDQTQGQNTGPGRTRETA